MNTIRTAAYDANGEPITIDVPVLDTGVSSDGSIVGLVGIKEDYSVKSAYLADGNVAAIAVAGTLAIGDLTQYGFPLASLVFTNAGANSATITWGVSQGTFYFQIAGTTPDVDLTGTNPNGDALTDVPIVSLGALTLATGQTLGAGNFFLAKV